MVFVPEEDSFGFLCFALVLSAEVFFVDDLLFSLVADEDDFFVLAPDEKSSSNSQEAA